MGTERIPTITSTMANPENATKMEVKSQEINSFQSKLKSLSMTFNLFGLIPRQVPTLLRVN